jgi:hypothetical protein
MAIKNKIKIYTPMQNAGAEENAQILQPGITNSNLCDLVELPNQVRTLNHPDGPYTKTAPQTPGRPKDIDLMILHGCMQPDQAIVWREQYPDIPAIVMDYKDELELYHPKLRVLAHFKRNMAIRKYGKPLGVENYSPHVVHFSPYCVREDIVKEFEKHKNKPRDMDVCCFFEPVEDQWESRVERDISRCLSLRSSIERNIGWSGTRRLVGSTLLAAKKWYGCGYNMHIGKTGGGQTEGRRTPQEDYCRLMATTKIIVTATPDGWEGDYRLMEAMSSGALVLHNRMVLPPVGLEDGKHWIVYDNHIDMLEKVYYYMANQDAAKEIGQAGKKYVMENHRPHHRVESWLRMVNIL